VQGNVVERIRHLAQEAQRYHAADEKQQDNEQQNCGLEDEVETQRLQQRVAYGCELLIVSRR
jgi:hypothetical protein